MDRGQVDRDTCKERERERERERSLLALLVFANLLLSDCLCMWLIPLSRDAVN